MAIWNIEPLIGVGPLKIGMSRAAVAKFLDPIHLVTSSLAQFDGTIRESRGLELPFCTFYDDKIQSIEIGHRVKNTFFENADVFNINPKDLLVRLQRHNSGAKYAFGVVLFYNISVSTGGFYEPKRGYFVDNSDIWQDERTVTVSSKDLFQPLLSQFKDINFEKRKGHRL